MSLSEPGRTFLGRRRLQIEEVVSRNKERSMNPRTDKSHMKEIVLKFHDLSLIYGNLSFNFMIKA